MSITSVQKDILNKLIDYIPAMRKGQVSDKDGGDIQLGSLIEAAQINPTEITLANGKILIGGASGNAVAQTLSSQVTITNAGVATVANSAVIAKVLTGYTKGAGTVAATDSLLAAVQKLDGNADAKLTAVPAVLQANSAAVDVAGIVADFNTLLGKLKTAGIMLSA